MMLAYDKFAAFFITMVMGGCGYLIYKHSVDKVDCVQSALSQNYSAESIKKICR